MKYQTAWKKRKAKNRKNNNKNKKRKSNNYSVSYSSNNSHFKLLAGQQCLSLETSTSLKQCHNLRKIRPHPWLPREFISSVRFSPLTDWVVVGDVRDDSAEILFQSYLQETLVSSSGMGRDVFCLMFSVLERLSWHVTGPNHASFRLWTAARRASCGPTRK